MGQQLTTTDAGALVLRSTEAVPVATSSPIDQNPAAVYLAGLAETSRRWSGVRRDWSPAPWG